ncbi:sulfite exporter TauE/SafE family protein [Anaerococcus octavius]|uniref:sulfite exporter TauE/SafE family protein n=1 Tax=Anaerococcus octavius TaxID=54007 RepID=UPI0027B98EAD|nr:TSUP family transporter [Anaerococcus octavius]
MILTVLKSLFYIAFVGFAGLLGFDVSKHNEDLKASTGKDKTKYSAIGFITNFGDTLGIGSFGPIVALFNALKVNISDRLIPGTLNVSCTLPVLFEAILFTSAVDMDPLTLALMIAAAVIGSYIGAGKIAQMDERKIQKVMGIALILAATTMLITHPYLGLFEMENNATGLTGWKLIVGIIGNFIFGALMSAGVGLYAPCMAMVSLLGMNLKLAFPIMMGSCALLMPAGSIKFIKEQAYDRTAAIFINLFGLLGVVAAYLGVKNANIDILKFVIIAVIYYTGYSMLKKSKVSKVEKTSETTTTKVDEDSKEVFESK